MPDDTRNRLLLALATAVVLAAHIVEPRQGGTFHSALVGIVPALLHGLLGLQRDVSFAVAALSNTGVFFLFGVVWLRLF